MSKASIKIEYIPMIPLLLQLMAKDMNSGKPKMKFVKGKTVLLDASSNMIKNKRLFLQ